MALPNFCFCADQHNSKVFSEIGVVNLQIVLTEALVSKDLLAKLSEMEKELAEKINKMEQSTKQEELEVLLKKKSTPKKKDVLKKLQLLKDKNVKLQQSIDEAKAKISQFSFRAHNKILHLASSVVEDIAKEKRLYMVLPRNFLLFAAPQVDITSIVVTRLNSLVNSLNIGDFVEEK